MNFLRPKMPDRTIELIEKLAHESPSLSELGQDEATAVAHAVLGDFLKDEMKRAVAAERIKIDVEVELFLQDQRSSYTRKIYQAALLAFGDWLRFRKSTLVDLTPAQADEYIRLQRGLPYDSDSVRLKVAVASSFYTFLERRHVEIRNPFRGTKARPRSSWVVATIPSAAEIQLILSSAPAVTKAVISVLSETGLRIGGLPEMRIKADGTYHTQSKGKRFEGFDALSIESRAAIAEAGLNLSQPFFPHDQSLELRTSSLGARVYRHCKRLHGRGLIADAYSPHDFRHAFAEAHLHSGIKRLSELLGHASIGVTEKYLRNTLGVNTTQM